MKPLRRDKPKAKSTMLDFIKENQTQDPLEKQVKLAQSNIHSFKYTDEYFEQVKKYNQDLKTNLDPMYTSVKPLHEILVRFYLHEPEVVGSIVMPFKQTVPVPTKSGHGTYQDIESDYPFRLKGVVIAAPESNQLKAGDEVMLSRKAIQMHVVGTGADAQIRLETGFVHPDAMLHDIPTDVTSQHYGYALVQYHEIKAKL